jgi:hypothetical protein
VEPDSKGAEEVAQIVEIASRIRKVLLGVSVWVEEAVDKAKKVDKEVADGLEVDPVSQAVQVRVDLVR